MGGLPQVPLHSEMVDVAGTKIEVRSLSRAQQVSLTKHTDDLDTAETMMLAMATGFTEDEVRVWRETTPGDVVGALSDEVARISGLVEGAAKSSGTPLPPS